MMPLGLIADIVLIALLVATLFYVLKLSRRLAELRQDRQSFEALVGEFAKATTEAQRSVAELRVGAESIGRELTQRIERGQSVVGELQRSADDLKMLINRADAAAGKLETAIGASRQSATPAVRPPEMGQAETPAYDTPAQDPDMRALLSALGRIR